VKQLEVSYIVVVIQDVKVILDFSLRRTTWGLTIEQYTLLFSKARSIRLH